METYAAKIIDSTVVEVIVGDASWAIERLGGEWIDTDVLVGFGYTWDGTNFHPPVEPDLPIGDE